MGIKELWPVLNPYCERKPLFELQGKVVAIDLAGWICESMCVVDYEVQARNYLRNLFFRTCYLLLSGVTPVFVLEGEAPALKQAVMSKRNEIQFRGSRPRKQQSSQTSQATQAANTQKKPAAKKGRSRFNHVLKQCETLLQSMGLQCVQGPGEAEAFCAHLNAAKLVDGVISQDSDCFAYGAVRVYRNFSVSTQGSVNAAGGSVDVYDMTVVQRTFDIGQNKMIAMALLCGCDYCPEGVGGVGRDAVTKLFALYSDEEILDIMKAWRSNDAKYTSLEMKVNDKSICANCGHLGKTQSHTRSGCGSCRTHVGCDESRWKEQRVSIKTELQIRKKCMEVADFPSQAVIDEFKQQPIDIHGLNLRWKQPDVVKFLRMMSKLLQWQEIYCFQKFLPLLTRWQLFHYGSGDRSLPLRGIVTPDVIIKKRAPKGIASYELVWKDDQKCFNGLIPDDQLQMHLSNVNFKDDTDAFNSLWSTVEPMDLVEKAYPQLVQAFVDSKAKKPKATRKKAADGAPPRKATKRGKKTVDTSLNDMSDMRQAIGEVDAALDSGRKKVPPKKKRETKKKLPASKNGLQTLHKFLLQEPQSGVINDAVLPNSPKVQTSSAPMNLSKFDFDSSDDSVDELADDDKENMSLVIRQMVQNAPRTAEFAGRQLRFDAVDYDQLFDRDRSIDVVTETEENAGVGTGSSFIEYRDCVEDEPIDTELVSDMPVGCTAIDAHPPIVESNKAPNVDMSFDEFDLLVMKYSAKGKPSILDNKTKLGDASQMRSSTPVLIDRFLNMHNESIRKQSLKSSLDEVAAHADLESSFFGAVNGDQEAVDQFEKSVDFKNMPDIIDLQSDSDQSNDDYSDVE